MLFLITLALFGITLCHTHDTDLVNSLFTDCGNENKKLTIFTEGSTLSYHPGQVIMTLNLKVLEDLPSTNFEMQINASKLTPKSLHIPCNYPIGSCTYDLCATIELYKKYICPPAYINYCKCPVRAHKYDLKIEAPVKKTGSIDTGKHKYQASFVDKSSNNEIVGCIVLTFEIVPRK